MARLPHLQSHYYAAPPEEVKAAPPQAPLPTASTFKSSAVLAPRPLQRLDTHAGLYVPKGDLPPHVYSEYQVQEERLCSPRFMRLTTSSVLLDSSSQRRCGIPIACVWQPVADLPAAEAEAIPLVASKKGPVRCSQCYAYANPFFIINGRMMSCNICRAGLQTPLEYISERDTHKELISGTCDFVAPEDYITKPAPLNVFFLCLDVSAGAVAAGLPQSVLTSMKACAAHIPCPARSRIVVLTYAETYSLYRPVLPLYEVINLDSESPFLSDPITSLMFALDSQLDLFTSFCDALIDRINSTDKPGKELLSPGALITAIKDSMGENGGKILLFASGLGTLGSLKLTQRDDPKLYNTDRESELFIPQHDSIYTLARDCSNAGISIDFYACGIQPYLDVSSVYPLVSMTGGDIHFLPRYTLQQAEKLHFLLVRTLTRTQVFQTILRVRVTTGLGVDSYIGHYNRKSATDMEIPILDSDKTLTILFKHEENLRESTTYYIQAAMLYTNLQGQRLIRVYNHAVTASPQLSTLYQLTDVNTLHNVFFKRQIMKMLDESVKNIREQWHAGVVALLQYYRESTGRQGEMAFPEGMGILPLLTIATMKVAAFSLSRVGPDLRMASVATLKGMPVAASFLLCYPRIYSLHDIQTQSHLPGTPAADGLVQLPTLIPASSSKLLKNGVYLIDNGQCLYLIVGPEVESEFLEQCFGVTQLDYVASLTGFPSLETEVNGKVSAVIEEVRRRSPGCYQPLVILPDNSPTALQQIRPLLVEDATPSELSYADYLQNLSRVLNS